MAAASVPPAPDIRGILGVSEVKVVQSIDTDALAKTLQWIMDRLPAADAAEKQQQALDELKSSLDGMHDKQVQLQDQLAQLTASADAASAKAAEYDAKAQGLEKELGVVAGRLQAAETELRDAAEKAKLGLGADGQGRHAGIPAALQSQLAALSDRLSDLELMLPSANQPYSGRLGAPDSPQLQQRQQVAVDSAEPRLSPRLSIDQGRPITPAHATEMGNVPRSSRQNSNGHHGLAGMAPGFQGFEGFTNLGSSPADDQLASVLDKLQDLSSRVTAAELKLDMAAAGLRGNEPLADLKSEGNVDGDMKGPPDSAQDNDVVAMIDMGHVSTLEDALPILRYLSKTVNNKADTRQLEPLVKRCSDQAVQIELLANRCAAVERGLRVGTPRPGTPSLATVSETASPMVTDNDHDAALAGRVFDLETSVDEQGGVLRQLQDEGVQQAARLNDIMAELGGYKELLEKLAAGAALSAVAGSDGSDGKEAAMDLLRGLLTDKATKADLGALESQMSAKATQAQLQDVMSLARDALQRAQEACNAQGQQARTPDSSSINTGYASGRSSPTQAPSSPKAAYTTPATRGELAMLSRQVGDIFADVADLRQQLAAMPGGVPAGGLLQETAMGMGSMGMGSPAASEPTSPQRSGGYGLQPKAAAAPELLRELHQLRDQLDWVAHAACIMAVGLEPNTPLQPANSGNSGTLSTPLDSSHSQATLPGSPKSQKQQQHSEAAPGLVDGREPRTQRGAVERLVRLLGGQSVAHKMDWFDPSALNDLASKVGMMEQRQAAGRGYGGQPSPYDASSGRAGGAKDLEAQLRRLSKEVRAISDRFPPGTVMPNRPHLGDHAMLSGKQLLGYRCLGCDRPLDRLHEKPAPHIPTAQMPIRVAASPDAATKAAMMRAPTVGNAALETDQAVQSKLIKAAFDPNQRGPQTWYNESKQLAADALPTSDVGPKLPPGGWRSSNTGEGARRPGSPLVGQLVNGLLPDIQQPQPSSNLRPKTPPSIGKQQQQQQRLQGLPEHEDHVDVHMGMLPSL